MQHVKAALLAAALFLGCSASLAAPITLGFSGKVHTFWTTDPSDPDPAQVGRRFSGAIVYDAGRAETVTLEYAANGSVVSHLALTREGSLLQPAQIVVSVSPRAILVL